MYNIKLLCHDFENKPPYHDHIEGNFPTKEAAEATMLHAIIDELNSLNGINEDGTFPERRFTVQMEDETHDAVIICWDGEDYRPVTCYDIVETGKPAMTYQRAMELLNGIINHVSVAENTSTQIAELTSMGYSPEELVNNFNYSQSDIDDYLEDTEDDE